MSTSWNSLKFAHKIEEYSNSNSATAHTVNNNISNMDTIFDQACIAHGSPDRGSCSDDATNKSTPSRVVSSDHLVGQYEAAACEVDTVPPPPHLVAACSTSDESITGRYCHIEHKYHIDPHVLGTGHHGSVRECIERTTGKRFAVKSIRKNDPNVKQAGLAREIMLLQEMEHSSIIQLLDVFEDHDYVHLVTELCEGGELFDKIVEKSSCENGAPCFREEEAAKIVNQILKGISYMHERGIVHRDIKPENILFDTSEEDAAVKIIDFGLSRKHSGSRMGEPPMSTVVGTPYYIAPEVLNRRYDKACDLWSVGVIAYILLCGYPPFNGTDADKTHKSVLRGKYYFPAEDWNDVSQDGMDFIYRLLQVDPKRRMTVEQALEHPWMVNQYNIPSCLKSQQKQDTPMAAAPMTPPRAPVVPAAPEAPPVQQRQRQAPSTPKVYCNELPRPRSWQTTPRQTTRKQHPACNSPPRSRVKLSMFHM